MPMIVKRRLLNTIEAIFLLLAFSSETESETFSVAFVGGVSDEESLASAAALSAANSSILRRAESVSVLSAVSEVSGCCCGGDGGNIGVAVTTSAGMGVSTFFVERS